MEINKVRLTGTLTSNLCDYVIPKKERENPMKIGWLSCRRRSGVIDKIPFVVPPENFVAIPSSVWENKQLRIYGHITKLPIFEDKNRFTMVVFAESVFGCQLAENEDENSVQIEGVVFKPPIYRQTPFGRMITDLYLVTPRNKRFIPVIAWGKWAEMAGYYNVGDHIVVNARFQSREYDKYSDGNYEKMLTFELSAFKLTRIMK